MACANSCSRHHEGVFAGRKTESRVALASVALDCRGSSSTAGGYFNPISVQIASTIDWALAKATKVLSRGAMIRFSQA